MIPVPALLALLAERADNGDEDAALQLNAMALNYPPEVLLAARQMVPTSAEMAHCAPAYTQAAPPPITTPTLGDILGEALAQAGAPQAGHDWELFEAATDIIANHYRLSRDAVFDALLELELTGMEAGGEPFASGALAASDGFSKIGLKVAQMLMIEADANALPLLTMTIH